MLLLNYLFAFLLPLYPLAVVRAATTTAPTPTSTGSPQFVRSQNGVLMLGNEPFRYIGTSAYWLQLLDNDGDMHKTLSDIASRGIKVVRTWAFNDVTDIPATGVWLRVFHNNGTIEINTGENGILRLDRIVRVAQQVGIHILFSLTNNWFPRVTNATTAGGVAQGPLNGANLPRNYLSNDFGGMDTYVKHFHSDQTNGATLLHDVFYTNQTIINSFHSYVSTIVKRYANEPSVLGWEVANDPRCNSTLPASGHNDPNHLVASGDSGFYCVDCTKLFPLPPPPSVSMTPGHTRREGPLTRAKLLARDDAWKRRNLPQPVKRNSKQDRSIRGGKWLAPREARLGKRQANEVGPLYDGTFGVDTEDLVNVPGVDFSSFQYFPDQNTYGALTTSGSTFDQVVQSGIDWIEQHAATANTYGKPATLNGFGLVTNASTNTYAPFDSSVVQQSGIGTTQEQQVSAYNSWITTAINTGVQGIIQYQWGQSGITSSSSPAITHQSGVGQANTSSTTFDSPNDGYAASDAVKGTLATEAAKISGQTTSTKRTLLEL